VIEHHVADDRDGLTGERGRGDGHGYATYLSVRGADRAGPRLAWLAA
jgi:hypothetical protein